MQRLIKHSLNTKTQRHEVAIAKQISRSKYREAIIAAGINIVYPPKTYRAKIPYKSSKTTPIVAHQVFLVSPHAFYPRH